MYSELIAAPTNEQDLAVQAEATSPTGGELVLVVSVVPGSAGPQLWVVAEQRPGGFSAARLNPVFQPNDTGSLAVFATDYAHEATDAAVWACGREGITLDQLTVVRKR